MCGLAYAHDFSGKPVNNEILNLFDAQRGRGVKGFGLFDGSKRNIVRATKENKILKWMCKYDSNLIMFHHREPSPTSVKNIKPGAHPYTTGTVFGDNEYILIHNGHISNHWSLLGDHEALGIKYRSMQSNQKFNDSESLLWDFARTIESGDLELDAYGAIAFMCIKLHKGKLEKLYFGRNSDRPLVMKRDKNGLTLSSEGDGDMVETNTLYTWHYKAHRLTQKPFLLKTYATDRGNTYEPSKDMSWYDHTHKPTKPYADEILTEQDMAWFHQKQQRLLSPHADNQIVTTPVRVRTDLTDEEIMEEIESFTPDQNEVQATAMDYLNVTGGHFNSALHNMECDYMDREWAARTISDYRQVRVLELALQLISADKEFVNEDSVSSYWIKGGGNSEPIQLPT